ncbi:MAG TPA: signal peptidase II [Alphaproteobacteria bacterium]|nr:signal peptidase II [Alphaproteobacteria bacterium]
MSRSAERGSPRPTTALAVTIAVLVIVADQLSKWWIVAVVMRPPRILPLTPFLNLVLATNTGVSFGMLRIESAWGPWLLSAFAVVVVVWLFLWQRRSGSRWIAAAVGLIAGGALGNVVDRLLNGAVTDFIDVYAGRYHWPAFNLADSAITIGVVIILAEALFSGRGSSKT